MDVAPAFWAFSSSLKAMRFVNVLCNDGLILFVSINNGSINTALFNVRQTAKQTGLSLDFTSKM